MIRHFEFALTAWALLLACGAIGSAMAQEPPLLQPGEFLVDDGAMVVPGGKSNAYPEGDYYTQLQAAGGLGGPGAMHAVGANDPGWGSGGSPFRTGPGCGDDWYLGPRWRVVADGLLMYREDTDLPALAAAIGATLQDAEHFEDFDLGGGVRLLGTAWWPQQKGYEITLGYIGVDEWNASVILPSVSLPPVIGPPESVGVDERRTLNYRSSLHSLELNWQALNDIQWKPYAGIRYLRLDERVVDQTRQFSTLPLAVGETSITRSTLNSDDVENNLIGFQLGLRRDLWNVSQKLYVQGFANAGVYGNFIDRTRTTRVSTTTTEVLEDDPTTIDMDETGQVQQLTQSTGNRVKSERTELSFVGEAAVTLVWKLNRCCALRSGYEVLVLSEVELADDAFLDTVQSRDLVYHGFFAGFEYRR